MAKRKKLKTTINLAQEDRKLLAPSGRVLISAGCALAAVLFLKVGVVDRVAAVHRAGRQAEQQEEVLAKTQEKLESFETVQQSYAIERQTQPAMNGSADAMACLALVESTLLHQAQVLSFTIAPQSITVRLSGVTLHEVSAIYQKLTDSELVAGVQVYTAATNAESENLVTASLTIALTAAENAPDEPAEQPPAQEEAS